MRPASAALLCLAAPLWACGGAPAEPTAATEATPTTGALQGQVSDDSNGEPLAFVTVTAWLDRRERNRVTTAGDGHYRLEGLPPGRYRIIAYASGRTIQLDGVDIETGDTTEIDIQVPATPGHTSAMTEGGDAPARPRSSGSERLGAIGGRVTDPVSGEGLGGAVVSATSPALHEPAITIAGDDGRFRVPSLPPGEYVLSVYYHLISRGNIEIRRSGIDVAAGETTSVDMDVDVTVDQ